jgi:hypothetical protein
MESELSKSDSDNKSKSKLPKSDVDTDSDSDKSKKHSQSDSDSDSKESTKHSESDSDSDSKESTKHSESDSDSDSKESKKHSESDSDSDKSKNYAESDSDSDSKESDNESDNEDEELNLLCKAFNTSTKVFTKFPPFGSIFPSLPIPVVMAAKAAAVGTKVADVAEQIVNNNVDKLNTLATAKIDAEVAQEEKKAADAQRVAPSAPPAETQGGGKIIFTKEECSFF